MEMLYHYATHEHIRVLRVGEVKCGCYLFIGDEGLGKCETAKVIAKQVLGVKNLSSSPDYYYLEAQDGIISVDSIHKMKNVTSYKAVNGDSKVIIINDANTMTISAQNALLKTLEDSSENNLFVLVSHTDDVIDTIKSRCTIVPFYTLEEEQMVKLFGNENMTLLFLANGKPGIYRRLQENHAFIKSVEEFITTIANLSHRREILEVLHLMKEKDKENFFEVYDNALIKLFLSMIRDSILTSMVTEDAGILENAFNKNYSLEERLTLCSAIDKAFDKLKKKGQFGKNEFFSLMQNFV